MDYTINTSISPYTAYELYISIKNHFSLASFDYFRYHGKSTISRSSMEERNDRYLFEKASKRYKFGSFHALVISNILRDRVWIGDMLDEEGQEIHTDFDRRHQSLSYIYKNDLELLFTKESPLKLFRRNRSEEFAPILGYILRGDISPETASILNYYIPYTKRGIGELFTKDSLKIEKYRSFITFDYVKMRSILKEKLNEHGFSGKEEDSRPAASFEGNQKELRQEGVEESFLQGRSG